MDTYIVGIGMTAFGRFYDLSVKELTCTAVDAAIKDAGCCKEDIQAAYFTNTTQGHLEGQNFIRGPIALRAMGFERIPMISVENACASGSTALWEAINYIRSGAGDVVLAVGAEKMNVEDKAIALSVFDSGWDISTVEENFKNMLMLGEGIEAPEGTTTKDPYSRFMDVYAAMARYHIKKHGLTQRQIAAVSAKNHRHSVHNIRAHFRKEFTVDEVLKAKPIVYPLTVPMCAPVTDGGAAVIICNEKSLSKYGFDRKRAIKIYSSVLMTGANRLPDEEDKQITCIAAKIAYEKAGVGPEDMSVAEVHDATAVGEIKQTENLGFCKAGEGGLIAERGETTIGGRIPVNPSGGLESKGHPIGATGLGQIFELVSQLRGECRERQVENARFAIQENGGGLIGIDEAVAVITILGK